MMPRRSLFLDLQVRNGIICHSCLSKTIRQPIPLGFASYSQQAAQTKPRRRQRTGVSVPRQPQIPHKAGNAQELRRSSDNAQNGQAQSPDVAMRYFEQDGSRRKELSDEHAFSESMENLGNIDLKDGLRDMKANLKSQEERDAFDAVVKQMTGLWKGAQTQDDIDKITADMDEYTRDIDAEIKEATSDLPRHVVEELEASINSLALDEDDVESSMSTNALPQISERSWNLNQRKKISKLNSAILRVHKEVQRSPGLSKKTISALYKAYHAARLTLARAWSSVPVQVWDILWTAFSTDEKTNPHRLSHVSLLARDMSEAKVTLSPAQQLLTIEAVFVDGWEAKAVENWRRCKPALGDVRSEAFQSYWELGVRMYCRLGVLDQAEQAAGKLLDQQRDARILMPLIQAWCEKNTPDGQKQAWDIYRRMRMLLGKEMKLSDYDQAVSYFLATSQTENALFAFVDMMSDGQIDMTKQKYMPTVIANKFFLGKWLKRLIGAGDLNGAHRVVEFMSAKGVQASAIQLNGLIGAWQRSGGTKDLEVADKVAWSMVEERIRFVNERNGSKEEIPQRDVQPASVPRATLETFCLLAENYRQRDLHQRQEQLWDAFHEAQISPDAFMMNQLLESYIQVGQHKDALALYESLVSKRGVAPDPYTFSALWKTPAVNRLHVVGADNRAEEMDVTRQLFRETLNFRSVFMPDGMDGQLARKILHSFRRLQDNSGMLVALAALRQGFKFLPPEMLAIEMLIGTQKLSWDTASQRKRLLIAKRELENGLMEWAEGDLDKLQDDKRGEALYSYLQKKFWPSDGTKDLVEAAKEMGAAELLAGKM